ncbi:hypothetical protein D9619_002146 [Psilocybe cf. subviscida]|uniref:Uncharacterized protein n=1 Tax=Psilocybe cf. subviscida TaxID=2480587 RepID=A0A8H5BDN7_9AGAR|nr:hypothetical protein D9619_002146 [Psilocybe cf. subviscida]
MNSNYGTSSKPHPTTYHGLAQLAMLNGMSGGVSSLSKFLVVDPATIQAPNDQGEQADDDMDSCGKLTPGIGVYAVDEGLAAPRKGGVTTRTSSWTRRSPSRPLTCSLLAYPTPPHAFIVLDFTNPAGAATRRLLSTSRPYDVFSVSLDSTPCEVTASLVDATNPAVFACLNERPITPDLALPMEEHIDRKPAAAARMKPVLADLRQAGAVRMGVDPDTQAQPKIALLGTPCPKADPDAGVDVVVHALSIGVLHKADSVTVGLCLSVAQAQSVCAETRNDAEGAAGR